MIKKTKDFFTEVRNICFHPKKFFSDVKTEKKINRSFRFLTIFTFVAFIFLTYYYIEQINKYLSIIGEYLHISDIMQFDINFKIYILFYVAFIVIYIISSFFRYYIIHYYARLFGGKEEYVETYKALSYSLAPEYVSTPLFILLFAMFPFLFISKSLWLIIIFVIIGIIYLIIFLYTIYLRIYALAELQKITMFKSFISIYVLGLITLLLLTIVIEIILIMIGFGVYLGIKVLFS